MYDFLLHSDYICIFKPTLEYKDGTTKGNCDAELVLQTMIEYEKYEQALIVSGDGDFYCLVKYLFDNIELIYLYVKIYIKIKCLLNQNKKSYHPKDALLSLFACCSCPF
jgi:hypothetical protein